MPLSLLVLAVLGLDAPVTQVMVFSDQARVTRTAQLALSGAQVVELPTLPGSIDPRSIRVETVPPAEVGTVKVQRVEPSQFRSDEARALLGELDQVDTDLARLGGERVALREQLQVLQRLSPAEGDRDSHKPAPKLNASGWAAATQFTADQVARTQTRLRDADVQDRKVNEKRQRLLQKAQKLGNPETATGWRVTVTVSGSGSAPLTVTYLSRLARWAPSWDIQLQPDANTVALALAGVVSQESGEDWSNASLALSTALPAMAIQVPQLTTWKIGTTERFMPTPTPVVERIQPPPQVVKTPTTPSDEAWLKQQLLNVTGSTRAPEPPPPPPEPYSARRTQKQYEFYDAPAPTDKTEEAEARPKPSRKKSPAAPSRPDFAPLPATAPRPPAEASDEGAMLSTSAVSANQSAPPPSSPLSLSPPAAWAPPRYGPQTPIALAGGYDLVFTSLQKESVPSNQGSRRVALLSQKWPVTVERKVYPALSNEAYLVAELKNPSSQVLPGGPAQLYVGADPAGSAQLKVVAPGEALTLPLGIDRSIKPVRNVQVTEATKGLVSKDEISTYTVTTELVNPYRTAVSVRVYDQWPVTTQQGLETKLLDSKPTAIQDAPRGALEWRLNIAPHQKQVISFTYSIKRPQGWKLGQSEQP